MAWEPKPSGFDFGIIIAFVAPGFVAFLGLAYSMPTAEAWLTAASDRDQSVGVFLFVVLASLSLGLVVSGVRALLVDKVFASRLLGKRAVPEYTVEWPKVDEKKLLVLITVRDNYYRFYQFYANTLVALLFWSLVRTYGAGLSLTVLQLAVVLAGVLALLWASYDSLNHYAKAVNKLFES